MAQLNPAWTPRVPARTLLGERCSLIGLFISALVYGITIPFAVMSMRLLYRSIDSTNRKAKIMWMVVVGFLFVCGTIYASSLLVMAELAFSTYREFPGGPSELIFLCRFVAMRLMQLVLVELCTAAFERAFRGLPVNTAGLVFFIMSTWICDAVMASDLVYILAISLIKTLIRYGDSSFFSEPQSVVFHCGPSWLFPVLAGSLDWVGAHSHGVSRQT
jgi:hypothetical protein